MIDGVEDDVNNNNNINNNYVLKYRFCYIVTVVNKVPISENFAHELLK
jgi:hypothetical protein